MRTGTSFYDLALCASAVQFLPSRRQTVWAGQLEDGGDVVPNVKEEMLDDALIFSRSVGIPESGEPDSE